ncbi:MAG: hypothetical protein KF819_13890 [Labilithrix sp.]|nr:hypothetical protein [Labilithrix sp.]
MDADELFNHALSTLPEAVGDLLREGRDPGEFIFASFDGSSALGMALIASDIGGRAIDNIGGKARSEVERMILDAHHGGEELVVSVMVTKDVLARILTASHIDMPTRVAVRMWLDGPVNDGHFRVVAIAGEEVRAGTVDGVSELDDAPVSSSMLN